MIASHWQRWPRVLGVVVLVAGALASMAAITCAQDNAADAQRLVKALDLATGHTIVEIGAGRGQLTVALAKVVGPTGRVYSNEINAARRNDIARAVEAAALTNVTIVEGLATEANVPEACCDAAFMRNVYHHFDDPAAMNRSLLASLKPGGRIAIIDFPPRRGVRSAAPDERATAGRHGVSADTVAGELRAAGFDIVSIDQPGGRWFMVVGRKIDD